MTPAQALRLEGFNASLTERGVSLRIHPAGATFTALVQPIVPDGGEFQVGEGVERESSKVHVLRTALPVGWKVGASLFDADANRYHRIERIEDHPANVAVVAVCETSEPSP